MRTAKTLIRLGGCSGWSESWLGIQSLCWFCHVVAQLYLYSNHVFICILLVIIIIIISILEPCFLYRGFGFLTSLSRRCPLHSERFWGSAESIPSFFLSFSSTSSHDFLGLPDPFCATTFSLRTSAILPVLRSACPNHLILLVRSTTSKSWMPSFVRREFELTSSFALTLQIQRIMARSLRWRRFSVSTF